MPRWIYDYRPLFKELKTSCDCIASESLDGSLTKRKSTRLPLLDAYDRRYDWNGAVNLFKWLVKSCTTSVSAAAAVLIFLRENILNFSIGFVGMCLTWPMKNFIFGEKKLNGKLFQSNQFS